jgi:hypothetical protein
VQPYKQALTLDHVKGSPSRVQVPNIKTLSKLFDDDDDESVTIRGFTLLMMMMMMGLLHRA